MHSVSNDLTLATMLLLMLLPGPSSVQGACQASDAGALIASMHESYSRVRKYRTDVEVKVFGNKGELRETKRFLYTFEKPNHIRIDLESPHKGMVLIYPEEHGKVTVYRPGMLSFLKLHLSPDNPLLQSSAGQRIDQTDMGLLIRNISHSLTDRLRGKEQITDEENTILISAVAENHFVKDKITLYRFFIDKKLCLPKEIEELTPDGKPQRTIIFHDLKINGDIQDD